MKVRYITEGVFKNPEQAKVAREKDREISNAEKLANNANKVVNRAIENFIDEFLNEKPDAMLTNEYYCLIPRSIAGNLCYVLTTTFEYDDRSPRAGLTSPAVNCKSKIEFVKVDKGGRGSKDYIYLDIYINVVDEAWLRHIKIRQEKEAKGEFAPGSFWDPSQYKKGKLTRMDVDGRFTVPGTPERGFFFNTLKENIINSFHRHFNEYIISQYDNKRFSNNELKIIGDIITKNPVILRRIHIFSGIDGDITFSGEFVSGSTEWNFVDMTNLKKRHINDLAELVSFENNGDIIFRDSHARTKDFVLDKPAESDYVVEGVFMNPNQAKAKREKEKDLTNADKVSGLYNNLYAAAKHRVITTEFMEYFTNYGKELDNERFWEVVNYSWYLAPFFKGQNCVDMGKYPEAKPIPGFNESLRVEYVCDDEEKMITVTPRYSFRLPEDWKAPALSCSSTKNSFKLTDTSWKIPTSSIEKDMIIRVQVSIGEKLAAETEKNRTMDSVVRKDLQKYQFKLGKIVLFDKIDEDIVLNMRVAYPDVVEDPSIRGDGFIPMIDNLLTRYSFGCKRFILTYDDMYGITHRAGSAYESSPAVKEYLRYTTLINDFGIDSYKLFEFLIKWNCISGAGGKEHAMKFYQRKYNRSGVEVFYKRFYQFIIENNTLTDKTYGSLLPLIGPTVAPISVEFYGVEMIYAYYGKNNIKLNKVFGYVDSDYMLIDDMKTSDDYTEDDELVIGWLNQIGERIAKIISVK